MSLGVEHPLVQVNLVPVGEQQVEVLEGLPEEERLHHVPGPRVQGVPHVADGRVAAGHLRVRIDTLENLPAPVLVGGVPGEVVQVEQALHLHQGGR